MCIHEHALLLGIHFCKSEHIKRIRWFCPKDHTQPHLVSFLLVGSQSTSLLPDKYKAWLLLGCAALGGSE